MIFRIFFTKVSTSLYVRHAIVTNRLCYVYFVLDAEKQC